MGCDRLACTVLREVCERSPTPARAPPSAGNRLARYAALLPEEGWHVTCDFANTCARQHWRMLARQFEEQAVGDLDT